MEYTIQFLTEHLGKLEIQYAFHADIAATDAKWMELGVHIDYYTLRFQEEQAIVEELRLKCEDLRKAIAALKAEQ